MLESGECVADDASDCALSWTPDSFFRPVEKFQSSGWSSTPSCKQGGARRAGCLCLCPPHLHGVTQFSYDSLRGEGAVWAKLKIPHLALGSSSAEGSLELLPSTCAELLARGGVQTARGFSLAWIRKTTAVPSAGRLSLAQPLGGGGLSECLMWDNAWESQLFAPQGKSSDRQARRRQGRG